MAEAPGPAPCACAFGNRSETSPDTEVRRGAFTLERYKVFREEVTTEWVVKCTRCGRLYRVVDDMGYWKTLYVWEPLKSAPA